jgi:exosortase family protein XrtF
MNSLSLREFKPTILFLIKFFGLYLIGNLLYGLYITAYYPRVDPVTRWISEQVAFILTKVGWFTTTYDSLKKPTTILNYNNDEVLAVYEGCNGLNTMIIFLAFLFAFGPLKKKAIIWFGLLGLVIIHVANILRIFLLFFVAEFKPNLMYVTHKYFFTAVLYIVIFLLWIWWVRKFSLIKNE